MLLCDPRLCSSLFIKQTDLKISRKLKKCCGYNPFLTDKYRKKYIVGRNGEQDFLCKKEE